MGWRDFCALSLDGMTADVVLGTSADRIRLNNISNSFNFTELLRE